MDNHSTGAFAITSNPSSPRTVAVQAPVTAQPPAKTVSSKLSLRGYDDEAISLTLTRAAFGRRVIPSDPARSLMLLKPTGAVPHKGGKRFRRRFYGLSGPFRLDCFGHSRPEIRRSPHRPHRTTPITRRPRSKLRSAIERHRSLQRWPH